MGRTMAAVTLGLALAALPARAHEKGGDRAMGVVESVTAEQIVIKSSDGHSVPFTVTAGTRFFREDEPVRREDVQVGQRAVVHGKRSGERVEAVRVKLGAGRAAK